MSRVSGPQNTPSTAIYMDPPYSQNPFILYVHRKIGHGLGVLVQYTTDIKNPLLVATAYLGRLKATADGH